MGSEMHSWLEVPRPIVTSASCKGMTASAMGPASATSLGVNETATGVYSDGVAQLEPQCIFEAELTDRLIRL
jgi:hypothetical protein